MRRGSRLIAAVAIGLLALVFVVPSASAEIWTGYGGGPDGNRMRGSDPTAELGVAWSAPARMMTSTSRCVSYKDGVVYTSYEDLDVGYDRMVALDAEDGQVIWETDPIYVTGSCLVPEGDKLYTSYHKQGLGWAVASLNAGDGSVNWENTFPEYSALNVNSRILVKDGRLFLTIKQQTSPFANWVYEQIALAAGDGHRLWTGAGSLGSSQPLIASGGTVVFNSTSYGYGIYDASTGSGPGGSLNPASVSPPMLLWDGGGFIHGSGDSVQYRAIGASSPFWTHHLGGPLKAKALISDFKRVYVLYGTDDTNHLIALDHLTGQPVWSDPVPGSHWSRDMYLLDGRLYLLDWGGGREIDPENGNVIGSVSGFPTIDSFEGGGVAYGDSAFYGWKRTGSEVIGHVWFLVALRDVSPPDIEITSEPGPYWSGNQTLTWTAEDPGGGEIESFSVQVGDGPKVELPATARSRNLAGLAPGINEVQLSAVDWRGNEATEKIEIEVDPSAKPVVVFPEIDGPMLAFTGMQFMDGGSHDTVLDGGIVRYEWDFDGDGTFETDAGNEKTVVVDIEEAGFWPVGLRVTNKAGNSSSVYRQMEFRALPPDGGTGGVSVNRGATFTNSPEVELSVSWPLLSTDIAVSNDGGFATSTSFPLPRSGVLDWTLATSGSERLPRQVYVRYWGTGIDTVTYRDDIILDQTPPIVEQASLAGAAAGSSSVTGARTMGASASRAKRKKPKRYRIRLKARDATSGVVAAQVSRGKLKGPVIRVGKRARRVSKVLRLKAKFRPNRIRVKDAAGNWSKFRRMK